MNRNILQKTKCYLIGCMQYADGRKWRDEVKEILNQMNITVFDPYSKPFTIDIDEGEVVKQKLYHLLEEENYDEVARIFKTIRSYDLSMVDKSDFIICHIQPTIPTFGTVEELVTAVRMKRPVFIFVEGGKKKCPLWLFGMIPHHYIYNSMDEVVHKLKQIDNGEIEIDENRWKLLKPELR